jgi:hypothetical protein
MGESFKLWGRSAKPLKYSSAPTRATSMQAFMGGAEGKEDFPVPEKLAIDDTACVDWELFYNSGVNRTDIPSAYGPPNVDKRLGNKRLPLANDLFTWKRNKGEVE